MAQLPGPALASRDSDLRLIRTVAIALLAAVAILALYFGRHVLIPTALAVFFAFILGPALTWVRGFLPLPLAVGVVVTGGLVTGGMVAVLVFSQLADVAGSLTLYQANLHQKIQDVRALAEGSGAVSRLMSMVASLAQELDLDAGPAAVPAVRVQSGMSSFASVVGFVAPLLYPLLSLGIIVILVVFILADRDHLSDQFVRLFGASDVHATSKALSDAAARVARVLALQLLTNLGFAVLVGLSLFALGMPNAVLWGLLAGALRFVPYVGAILGAVLPTVIAFAVLPGWLMPLLVLGCIVVLDVVVGQLVEPLLFGESTGVNPLALILSAIFWGSLWGPIGLLLSTPLTICLLVVGKHVPGLGVLEVMLGDEPALAPYQQIYRRLIRRAVADASAVALAEIDAKGPEAGLDDALGRMVVLAEADDTLDRLSATERAAIVDGTDEVLEFLSAAPDDVAGTPAAPAAGHPERREDRASFRCIGGRGGIDDAAAAIFAFALRRQGFEAEVSSRVERGGKRPDDQRQVLPLICYASHPSDAVRRYNRRKLPAKQALHARHAVIDYDVAPTPPVAVGVAGPHDVWVGDIGSICRLAAHHALEVDGQ